MDKQSSKQNKQKDQHGSFSNQGKNSCNSTESKKDSGQDRCDDTKSWKS